MMNKMKKYLVLSAVLMLSGCMSPVKVGPDTGYVINSMPDRVAKSGRHSSTLLVLHPETNPAFNTTRIAFTMHPYQLSYYSQSRWIEAPADMFAPLIAQSLQNTGRFKSVVSPPFSGQYQYSLRTQIKTLQVDYARRLPALELDIQANLISAVSGNVIATRDFKLSVPLEQHTPYGAAEAGNRAGRAFLKQLTSWCLERAR